MMQGTRPTISSRHGMVAAAHPLAAQAGARLLASRGNAFDAAAATAAALNVVEPFMSGLAGQGLATAWIAKESRVRVLDFVPTIPKSFPADRFTQRSDLERGALSVGTPGNLAGWCELVTRYGRKPLTEIFAPAIALARDGFALAEFGTYSFNDLIPIMARYPDLHEVWAANYTQGAKSLPQGHVVRQGDLADTFTKLANEGPGYLYGGPLGEKIIAHLNSLGGVMTMQDLLDVAPVWREPLAADYRGLSVNVPPPACEGFQFLLTLRILEAFDLGSLERNGVEHLDLVYRAIRLSAGERIAHNDPSPDVLAQVMSDANIERLRAIVRNGQPITGPTEQWVPSETEDPGHTTSMSIADSEGNLLCMTQSLGALFGSGVVVPGTGVCLNNFLYWADVQPGSPNRSKGGSSLPICMAPSISTRDGKPVLALGTPGSYGILQTQPQALIQHIDFGLRLQPAIEAPRARLWDGRHVQVENRIAPETAAALKERGHDIEVMNTGFTWVTGGMQGVAIDQATGVFTGAADPRRDGYVATP